MGHLITPGASGFRDCLEAAHDLATQLHDGAGFVGYGVVELTDGDGNLKSLSPFANLITDAGDLYTAQKVIVGIAPAAPSAPTAMSGMKLGTGTTAVAKNGAGAALVTYLAGSNLAFDATFPSTANLGAGAGVNAVYKATWAAGVATNAAITEAVIVNDAGTNATSTAANTGSRAIITTTNKGANDTLAITWNWRYLGA
jgi:hypothetical protein